MVRKVTTCQVCNGKDFQPLGEDHAYHWIQCRTCGFATLSEMPDFDEAVDLQDADKAGNYIGGYARETSSKKFKSKMRRSRHRARMLKRRMKGPKLLDVGSNVGMLVGAAHDLGLESYGVEINPDLVAYARQHYPECTFRCGRIEEVDFDGLEFDGVYTSEVIEHVTDINSFLSAIANLMKPGAVMYLTTPEITMFTKSREKDPWRRAGAPDHKIYFSKQNIVTALENNGFERVNVLFNWAFKPGIKLFAYRSG